MAHAARDATGTKPGNRKRNLISYQMSTRLTPFSTSRRRRCSSAF